MPNTSCPCCSGKNYNQCCAPFHQKIKVPTTAEQLMRSRYSAYVFPNGEYLWETTLPSKRKYHSKSEMEVWGKSNDWTKLEIINQPFPEKVEFRAYFTSASGVPQIHHERSTFKKVQNRWFYVSGEFLEE